jgi:glyoxylase-like metal-dependent hydrolase (beta-lactamase superfamily II)
LDRRRGRRFLAEVRVVEARVERVRTPRVDADETVPAERVPPETVPPETVPPETVPGEAEAGRRAVNELNAWLIGDDEEVIVIDPGEDAASVLEQVGEREVLAVICTHGHAAHVAAAVAVAERDESPVALHAADRLLWRVAYQGEADDPEIKMADGGRFEVSDVVLEVIGTPGHTPGSVSLYCAELGVVFTGDALCARGPVPHDGDFANFPAQLNAIGERLLDLPPGTRVQPGHGEESTVGDAGKRFDGWVTAGPGGGY